MCCGNVAVDCAITIPKKYFCNYCNRIFNHRSNKFNHEKICKLKLNLSVGDVNNKIEKLEKENLEIKNILKELIEKNCKIHPKTLQRNNNTPNIPSDDIINITNNNYKSYDNHINNEIIKSNDNKFKFDLNKNFLTFNNKPIKYFYYNDQVYFKAKDIAKILEYENTKQAIKINVIVDDKIKINQLLGGGLSYSPPPKTSLLESEDPKTVFINESGFYSLILASKKTEAIEFKKWVTSIVLPSIRKTGGYNLIDNYIEEDLEKYHNKDCVYIIHIKDNIYKYGNTSHIFKRLQTHKTNLKYNKIIKIFDMNNMNEAIKLENKIKTLIKTLNINTVYNTHVEIFKVDNNNLQNLIKKIDELSFKIINTKIKPNILLESEKTKQLALENENLKLKLADNTKQLKLENENLKLKLADNTKQLELENENLKLKLELFKLSNNYSS
jgi:prophage antirepressor-like protein